jgi:hypothetical protein
MSAVVYTRVPTSAGRLQVFVADFDAASARAVQLTLDGAPIQARALRPLSSVRGPRHGIALGARAPRAFVGTYEIGGLTPGRQYRVGVRLGGESPRLLDRRVLPARVPSDADGGFDVLLSSCFHRAENDAGALTRAMRQLVASVRPKRGGGRGPDMSLLLGDQVYLDMPTLQNFPDRLPWLATRFEDDYRQNWQGAMSEVLGAAPFACVPDDHEYWNNAPQPSPLNGNTQSAEGRRNWMEAATLSYQAFAQPFALAADGSVRDATDHPLIVDVHPLSFFLADARSKRDAGRSFAFTPQCRACLRDWVDRNNRERRVGVFVCGQSLLSPPVSEGHGQLIDWQLANYRDHAAVMAELGRATQRLLLLTGDVHFGRVSTAVNRFSGEPMLHEVVVSPLSLVTTLGLDQGKLAWSWVTDLVGRKNQWPRHPGPELPPDEVRLGKTTLRCQVASRADGSPALIQGNQLGLLSFDWTLARLRATVTYFPVHHGITAPIRVPLFDIPLP